MNRFVHGMTAMRVPRLRLLGLVEAVAAAAVLLAFWRLRMGAYKATKLYDAVTFAVTTSLLFAIAAAVFGWRADKGKIIGKLIGMVGGASMALALWFVAVEWRWSVLVCPRCRHCEAVNEYSLFSLTVRRDVMVYPTATEYVAADLGIPCAHESMTSKPGQRRLGLCFDALPEPFPIPWGPPCYPACARQRVRSRLAQDRSFIRSFRESVLGLADYTTRSSVTSRIYADCPPEELPPYVRQVPAGD